MPLKVTLTFKMDAEGWSETYFTNNNNIPEYVGSGEQAFTEFAKVGTLVILRRKALVTRAFIEHIRVTDLSLAGVFDTYDFPSAVGKGRYGGIGAAATEVFSSLLINLKAGITARRRVYLAGLPEEIITPPQFYKPVADFEAVLKPFLNHVTQAPYIVRSRPRIDPLADQPITSFSVSADGRHARVTPLVRPITNPSSWYVVVRGLKAPPGWNGVHQASLGTVAGTMVLGPTRRPMRSLPEFELASTARVVLYAPVPTVLTAWDIVRIVSRRRGRPFGVSRGRR